MDDEILSDLLRFFKALIDPDRLAVAGRLAAASATIESLSAELGLPRIDVQRHLDRLIEAGLVRADGRTFTLDRDALHVRARRVLSSGAATVKPSDSREKVLFDYLRPDGSLKEIPSQLKKKHVVYEHIVARFDAGRRYSEKEINELLAHFHADFVSIRRDLFDLGYLDRAEDGSAYWRRI
jgi:hypothetical protein